MTEEGSNISPENYIKQLISSDLNKITYSHKGPNIAFIFDAQYDGIDTELNKTTLLTDLINSFEILGFTVIQYTSKKWTLDYFEEILVQFSAGDFDKYGSVAVYFIGHGTRYNFCTNDFKSGILYDDVLDAISLNLTLKTKLKWIIFDCCRGPKTPLNKETLHKRIEINEFGKVMVNFATCDTLVTGVKHGYATPDNLLTQNFIECCNIIKTLNDPNYESGKYQSKVTLEHFCNLLNYKFKYPDILTRSQYDSSLLKQFILIPFNISTIEDCEMKDYFCLCKKVIIQKQHNERLESLVAIFNPIGNARERLERAFEMVKERFEIYDTVRKQLRCQSIKRS